MGNRGAASGRSRVGKTSQHARESKVSQLRIPPTRALRDWSVSWRLIAVIVLALVMGLVFGGNMYGVTFNGGDAYAPYIFIGYGAVFRLATNGALTRLASFHGTNGASPNGLMAGANGGFYGTTQGGGTYGSGTIFRLDNTPLSQPVIQSVEQMSGTLFITWTAVAGQSYQVQYSTNLTQGAWNNLGSAIPATNGIATTSDTIGPDARRFYRVALLP